MRVCRTPGQNSAQFRGAGLRRRAELRVTAILLRACDLSSIAPVYLPT
jgi:hypothetical protein